jgi:thiamine pyrophosphate-dependent acetolactate synthase large subunit-like protein
VEILGGRGEFVEEIGQLRPALERAFNSNLPSCILMEVLSVQNPDTSYLGPLKKKE